MYSRETHAYCFNNRKQQVVISSCFFFDVICLKTRLALQQAYAYNEAETVIYTIIYM